MRENTKWAAGLARTHRVCCPRAGPRGSAARRGCASPTPVPGGEPRARARAHRGRNAHVHVAGRMQPCAPVCGTGARRRRVAGNTPPWQKQHTRWQPASMRAARARPRRRRGRARRPRRVADASPLPVDADALDDQFLSMAKNVQNVCDVPRASPRIAWKSVRFGPKTAEKHQNVCVRPRYKLCRGPKTRGVTSGVSKVFLRIAPESILFLI